MKNPKNPLKKNEQGSVTLEFTLIYGILLGLVLTILHFGLLYHVSITTADAADVSLEALQSPGTDFGNASTYADEIVRDWVGGTELVKDLDVDVEVADAIITVKVAASSPRLIFGLPNRVIRQASGPVERFLPEGQG